MQNKIIAKLNEVFDDIFGVSNVTVTTSAKDVPGWDSLMHITLISEVEDVFGVKYDIFFHYNRRYTYLFIKLSREKRDF